MRQGRTCRSAQPVSTGDGVKVLSGATGDVGRKAKSSWVTLASMARAEARETGEVSGVCLEGGVR